MSDSKLDKCPICGKTDTLRIMEGDRVWIECMDGEDACGLSTGFFDTIAEAIAAWNTMSGRKMRKTMSTFSKQEQIKSIEELQASLEDILDNDVHKCCHYLAYSALYDGIGTLVNLAIDARGASRWRIGGGGQISS